jgi:hypothetical protein
MPDPSDRHVVAAPVTCDADIICSDSLKDFPEKVMRCVGVGLMSADQLLQRLTLEGPARMSNVRRSTVVALKDGTIEKWRSLAASKGHEAEHGGPYHLHIGQDEQHRTAPLPVSLADTP